MASGSADSIGIKPKGHALHPIDVEHADRVRNGVVLAARACDKQQIARLVGSQKVCVRRHGLDDALHLRCGHIFQRNDLGADAGQAAAAPFVRSGADAAASPAGTMR